MKGQVRREKHTISLYLLTANPLLPQIHSYSEKAGRGINRLSPGFINAVMQRSSAPLAPEIYIRVRGIKRE